MAQLKEMWLAQRQSTQQAHPAHGAIAVSLLTLFALLVHGYHPDAEDGGLYIAGIKKLLNPALYPVGAEFVTQHLRLSLFAPLVVALVRTTGLTLPSVLFALYCISIFLTLYAAWMLASGCTRSTAECVGAVALLACWLTLPIAGTSLMLTDPYLTGRSLSTPLILFALAWALDAVGWSTDPAPSTSVSVHPRSRRLRGGLLCALALAAAFAMHPLMAGYGLVALLVLWCVGSERRAVRRWGPPVLCACGLALAEVVQLRAPAESPAYLQVAMTRYYWFPFRWHWYEQLGLLGPMAMLLLLARTETGRRWQLLSQMALALGAIGAVVAILFSRPGLTVHLAAHMQPLRTFQLVYEVMILVLGAYLGRTWLQERVWRWALLLVLLGSMMFYVQRNTFPASAHLELPWRTPRNPWAQAFLWIRDHAPANSVFALDAHYITREGEDAQNFRSIAERSALPDYSKDGGEASDTPELTGAWIKGQAAQTHLDLEDDPARLAALQGSGATWIVLEQTSPTAFTCPYRNQAVKVCRLP